MGHMIITRLWNDIHMIIINYIFQTPLYRAQVLGREEERWPQGFLPRLRDVSQMANSLPDLSLSYQLQGKSSEQRKVASRKRRGCPW